MPDVSAELLARFRRNEIDLPQFMREAEELSQDDWEKLSALILEWFGERATEPSSDR